LKNAVKTFISLFTPFLLLILAYIVFLKITTISQPLRNELKYLSYVVFLIGILISCWFNRSRVFFIIVILFFTQFLLNFYFDRTPGKVSYLSTIYAIVTILVPLNIAIFSFFKERGILTLWGFLRISFVLFQILFTAYIIISQNKDFINDINRNYLSINLHKITPLSQLSLLAKANII
jgi:hypothetical protein